MFDRMIMRIVDIDPRSDIALSLLREAAIDVRPLYGEAPGPPWPQNLPMGPRDAYVAAFNGYEWLRLETGNRQGPAISLYERYGFSRIEPFGCYVQDPTSVCYELRVNTESS
jgi:hypothetical protein